MLTMEPLPMSRGPFLLEIERLSCDSMAFDTARTAVMTPLALTLIILSKSSTELLDIGVCTSLSTCGECF